ncbi:hypothetical protein E2320_022044 [Naja naja]|nr:hypothetical protein E2320_022044 [Naja naja]
MVASSRGPIFLPSPAKYTQALWVSSRFCRSRRCAKISLATPSISTAKGSLMFRSTLEAGKSFWAGEPSLLRLPHSVNLQSRGGHRCRVVCQSLRGQVVEEGQELGGRKGQISKPDSTKVINLRRIYRCTSLGGCWTQGSPASCGTSLPQCSFGQHASWPVLRAQCEWSGGR